MSEFVCKHCGHDRFFVNVKAPGWQDGEITTGSDGRPQFDKRGSVEVDHLDADIEAYVCDSCRTEEWKLTALVVQRPAEGDTPIGPCGRCDHGRADHGEHRPTQDKRYTRAAMPCEREGCGCHDYYDRAFAEAGVEAVRAA